MISVYLSGSANSTMFTRCCSTAICDDQAMCPACGKEVYPGKEATTNERSRFRWEMAYGPTRRALAERNKGMR